LMFHYAGRTTDGRGGFRSGARSALVVQGRAEAARASHSVARQRLGSLGADVEPGSSRLARGAEAGAARWASRGAPSVLGRAGAAGSRAPACCA
jgi:hypothetical protein